MRGRWLQYNFTDLTLFSMTEAMSIEGLTAAYWELQKFWTRLRVPFRTEKNGTSDIDVLGFNPEVGILLIGECKAHGNKRVVFPYNKNIRERFGDILASDNKANFKNLQHFSQIFQEEETIFPLRNLTKKVVYHHVSNLYITTTEEKEIAEKHIADLLKPQITIDCEIEVRLNSTLEIICELLEMERSSNRSKRFGNPFLDFVREVNRYIDPTFEFRGSGKDLEIANELKDKLRRAMKFD